MKRSLIVLAAALAVGLGSGCSLVQHIPFIGHNAKTGSTAPKPPKEDSHVATQSETEFKQRWVDKRTSELVAQGLAPDTARAQAVSEFDQKFAATHVAH
jgi:hypothetical protein